MRIKTVAAFALFFFLFGGVAYPQHASSIQEPVSNVGQGMAPSTKSLAPVDAEAGSIQMDLNPYNITIPEELGSIEEVSQGAIGSPLIVHIQNVHANYETQVNIKGILKHLVGNYNFSLIQQEGAASKLDPEILQPSYLREANLKLMDLLLRQGRITGADAFAVETDQSVELYGIEDYSLYMENVRMFRQIYKHQDEVHVFFDGIHRLSQEVAPKLFDPELLDFTRKTEEFSTDRIDLLDYLIYMNQLSEKHKLVSLYDLKEIARYPNLVRLMRLHKLEGELNRSGLKQETAALKLEFEKKMPGSQKAGDLLSRLEEKAKGVNPRSYFLELTKFADEAGIDFIAYPAFRIFAEFLIHQDEIDHRGLFSELKAFERELQEKLFVTEDDRAYLEIIDYTGLLEQYFRLEMSREKLALYVDHRDEIKPSKIAARLQSLSGKYGARAIPLSDTQKLDSYMDDLEYFYQIVLKRDEIFVDKILERMRSLGWNSTILVTGGFHKDGLMDHYKKENVSYVIVSPKVNVKEGNENYLKVMLEEDAAQGSVFTGTFALEIKNLLSAAFLDDQGLRDLMNFYAAVLPLGFELDQRDQELIIRSTNEALVNVATRSGVLVELKSVERVGESLSLSVEAQLYQAGTPRHYLLQVDYSLRAKAVTVREVRELRPTNDLDRLGIQRPSKHKAVIRTGLPKLPTTSGRAFQGPIVPPTLEESIVLKSVFAPRGTPQGERSSRIFEQLKRLSPLQISIFDQYSRLGYSPEQALREVQARNEMRSIMPEDIEKLAAQSKLSETQRKRLEFFTSEKAQPGILVWSMLGDQKSLLAQLNAVVEAVEEPGTAAMVYAGKGIKELANTLGADTEILKRIEFVEIPEGTSVTILERMVNDLSKPGRFYNLYQKVVQPVSREPVSPHQLVEKGYIHVHIPTEEAEGVKVSHPRSRQQKVSVSEAVSEISRNIPQLFSAIGRPKVKEGGLQREEAIAHVEAAVLRRLPRSPLRKKTGELTEEAREFMKDILRKYQLSDIIVPTAGGGWEIAQGAEALVQELFDDMQKAVRIAQAA